MLGEIGFRESCTWCITRIRNEVNLLEELERRMKERDYAGGSMGLVFVDVEQEAKEEIVSLHQREVSLGIHT
ncbi:conserved hypothetical protein [Ricinus communis]|uniref:Uncharacterized protein n=1 Tax=Ricinus communis TaxID=3988 RepID=B9RT27_RICCO|nr:conserved hypothetical protein [Ricinus communis]